MLRRHLALAEGHVTKAERQIAGQHELIIRLELDGHDTTAAIKLLVTLEVVQAMHVADRERLTKELARPAPPFPES